MRFSFLVSSHSVLALVFTLGCGDSGERAPGGAGASGASGGDGGTTSGGSGGDSGAQGSSGDGGSSTGGTATGGAAGSATGGTGGADPYAHCSEPWKDPPAPGSCDLDALVDGGVTLTGDIAANLTLESGKSYALSGPTRVLSGVTLTIQPCVKLLGQSPESVLAIQPGARIEAAGQPDAPIVFTSNKAAGSRKPGDWGGLIVLGNAQSNMATATARPTIEGLVQPEFYGSHTPDANGESSGTLTYARIEYVGRDLGNGNETNGLTMGGVGSGTTIHHVMVSNSIDDCFEWFGGTVNASHLIALNCDDDMFDTDHGYSGKVQFAFGRQFPQTAEGDSSGFEMDNQATNKFAVPMTSAQWSNVTLCGTDQVVATDRYGIVLRNNVGGAITNTIVTGFHSGALAHREGATAVTHTLVFGNDALFGAGHAGGLEWFTGQAGNSVDPPALFCDCWANPPVPFPVAKIAGAAPSDFPVPGADYIGAFEAPTSAGNWMHGPWVDWAEQ